MRSQRLRTSAVLVVLLVMAFPLSGSLVMAGREAGASAGILSVESEPAGATVYVDGRERGQTPLHLEGLSEGDHRVNLVKDGYLENSRVLRLRADRADALSVTLTPSGGRPNAVQIRSGGGGGGGSIWSNPLFLGAVVAGGGTVAYLATRDSNETPFAGSVRISPGTTGLAAATAFSFSTSASDPDGDSLTFRWDFGDGASATGETVTHTYASAGTFRPMVTVDDGEDSASATGSVTVRDLAGTWTGAVDSFFDFTFTLQQSSTSISGTYLDADSPQGPGTVSGSVSPQRAVTLTVNQPPFSPFTFTGTANGAVSQISGTTDIFGVNLDFFMSR